MKIEGAIKFLEQYTNSEVYTEKCVSAHLLALTALRSMSESGEYHFRDDTKLSLEQLKQMDGKPVWIEDTSCWGLVFIPEAGRFKNAPFVLCRKRGVQIEWQVEGNELTIYSYPPAHIDRSKWEECKYCKTCWTCKSMVSPSRAINTKCFSCENLSNHEPLNFCPHCGRPLTEEAWVELERRLKGENS